MNYPGQQKKEIAKILRERAKTLENEANEEMINEAYRWLPDHLVNRIGLKEIKFMLEIIYKTEEGESNESS